MFDSIVLANLQFHPYSTILGLRLEHEALGDISLARKIITRKTSNESKKLKLWNKI